jgi:CheY-like chemotaxis protein
MDSARAQLARRILEALARGETVSTDDAIQLRNWAARPKDITLPLEQIAHHIVVQQVSGEAKTILVADGNSQRLERTQEILTDAGYQVLTANSAEEAEAIVDTEASFDLVVCSVVMELGGDTGIHLAEHIEFSKRTNSTLLVSHFAPELLSHISGFSRQRHFLANPFTAEELLSRVRDLLVAKPN